MAFAGLFREEVEDKALSYEARSFLDAVRGGATQAQALEHADVSGAQLVVWRTHLRFRKEMKIAERGEGVPKYTPIGPETNPDPYAIPPPSAERHSGRLDSSSGVPGSGSPEFGGGRSW
jgi:hypothetical protein